MQNGREKKKGKDGAPGATILSVRVNERGLTVGDRGPIAARRKKETIMIKVEGAREWLEIYKIMAAKNTIEGATGVRRTRAGHIPIEFDRKVEVNEVTEKLKADIRPRRRYQHW